MSWNVTSCLVWLACFLFGFLFWVGAFKFGGYILSLL